MRHLPPINIETTNVLGYSKDGGDSYLLLYDDESRDAAMEQLKHWARDAELDFDWRDATALGAGL